MDQPCKVANPARGQLNRDNSISCFPVPVHLRHWSRENRFGRRLLILHTQTESGAFHGILPAFHGGVHLFIPPTSATQTRTDAVHCRESAGTRSVVLTVVPATGAAFSGIPVDQVMGTSFFSHPLLVYIYCSGHVRYIDASTVCTTAHC